MKQKLWKSFCQRFRPSRSSSAVYCLLAMVNRWGRLWWLQGVSDCCFNANSAIFPSRPVCSFSLMLHA